MCGGRFVALGADFGEHKVEPGSRSAQTQLVEQGERFFHQRDGFGALVFISWRGRISHRVTQIPVSETSRNLKRPDKAARAELFYCTQVRPIFTRFIATLAQINARMECYLRTPAQSLVRTVE